MIILRSVASGKVLVLFAILALVPRVSSEGIRGALHEKERDLQDINRYIVKYKNSQGKARCTGQRQYGQSGAQRPQRYFC